MIDSYNLRLLGTTVLVHTTGLGPLAILHCRSSFIIDYVAYRVPGRSKFITMDFDYYLKVGGTPLTSMRTNLSSHWFQTQLQLVQLP